MMSSQSGSQRLFVIPVAWVAVALFTLATLFSHGPAGAQTFAGVLGERNRIIIGFRVDSDVLQALFPSPWRLNPLASGPLKEANFFVVLIDAVRDVDADGKPKYTGGNPFVVFAASAKNPETGQMASVVLSGFASNPGNLPGYYQVYQPARLYVEHSAKSKDIDSEEVTDIWEVRDAEGTKKMEFRLRSERKLGSRTTVKGEAQVISAKNPALWRLYKFEAVTDIVRSVPNGIDLAQDFQFRLSVPEYARLFDGTEKLVGVTVSPWYVRQIFVR